MGYAIFTARKLMLTNRLNQLKFRIMQLSQQQETLAQAAGDKQRSVSWTKNMFASIGNIFTTAQEQQKNAAMWQLQQKMATSGGKLDEKDAATLTQLLSGQSFANSPMGTLFNVANQMIDMESTNEMRRIKDMENQIELERKTLETQVAAMQGELKSVEDAENKEIERSAPKFA